jgi:hypothetical protein
VAGIFGLTSFMLRVYFFNLLLLLQPSEFRAASASFEHILTLLLHRKSSTLSCRYHPIPNGGGIASMLSLKIPGHVDNFAVTQSKDEQYNNPR